MLHHAYQHPRDQASECSAGHVAQKSPERPKSGAVSSEMEMLFCPFLRIILLRVCVSFSPQMGSSDLPVGRTTMRVAWRCITGDSGAPSVVAAGLS